MANSIKIYMKDGTVMNIPEDLILFVYDITLFLQQPGNYNAEKIEPVFQRAYKLYVKYDVEKRTA